MNPYPSQNLYAQSANLWTANGALATFFVEQTKFRTLLNNWENNVVNKATYNNIFVDYVDSQITGYKDEFMQFVRPPNYTSGSNGFESFLSGFSTFKSTGLTNNDILNLGVFVKWLGTNRGLINGSSFALLNGIPTSFGANDFKAS